MIEFDAIKNEYESLLKFNKTGNFIHSIDIEKYKADCKNFFAQKSNQKLFLKLSENSFVENESVELFENWLKKGWYGKTWRDIFCRP